MKVGALLSLLATARLHRVPTLVSRSDASTARRHLVISALKRFDQLAAMTKRGDPEGCSLALKELAALDTAGVLFALGPNAHNRAMRVCSGDVATVEKLYTDLAARGLADDASLEALARMRLENDMLVEAADAVAGLLARALASRTTKLGRVLPRKKLTERSARVARAVLEACSEAGLIDDRVSNAAELWAEAGKLGLWASPPPAPVAERTLALLKPDCVSSGAAPEVEAFIASHGFTTARRRCWRMEPEEAASFLATSWGSASGDRARCSPPAQPHPPRTPATRPTHSRPPTQDRRFFSEMVSFYTSGDVLALLLEKEGAIAEWRRLLGPGDPAVARGYTDHHGKVRRPKAPHSVRARWGSNKQANAAHGADSPEAAAREIAFIFGEGWSEAGAWPAEVES